jgi:hypothetical protein
MPKPISKQLFDEIERLLELGGRTHTEIAASVGVTPTLVDTIARGKHHYQVSAQRSRQPNYLPLPEEIEAECARLRAARKQSEDDEPEGDDSDGWPPPGITLGTLD